MKPGHRIVGLFAGVGGVEQGFQLANRENRTILYSENDAAASAVLADRFPDVENVGDVTELDTLPESTTLVTAGFPCQDLSQAGDTGGINGRASGLVRHVFRLLEQSTVPWVVLENVPFMLQLDRGAAIRFLVEQLERLGYRWAYRVVDSRAFGLPQRRQRVLLLASSVSDPSELLFQDEMGDQSEPDERAGSAVGFYWTEGLRGLGWAVDAVPTLKGGSGLGIPSPPAVWLPTDEIVTPSIEVAEQLQGFSRGWTRAAAIVGRRSGPRWKLVGNAVTVHTARWLADAMERDPKPLANAQLSRIPIQGTWPRAACGADGQRFAVLASPWPRMKKRAPLVDVIGDDCEPLSYRATSGFLERYLRGTLVKRRDFIAALEKHRKRMNSSRFAARIGEEPPESEYSPRSRVA